jgi:hypothetical protein
LRNRPVDTTIATFSTREEPTLPMHSGPRFVETLRPSEVPHSHGRTDFCFSYRSRSLHLGGALWNERKVSCANVEPERPIIGKNSMRGTACLAMRKWLQRSLGCVRISNSAKK